jgi:hypothetical protein
MSKKKLNTESVLNELQGSVFFPPRQELTPDSTDQETEQPTEDTLTRIPETQETRFQENLETRKQENLETSKQVSKETRKRTFFPKVTYQLDPEVTDLLEDTKKTLKRTYGLKVGLAEIVEEGIRVLCHDLEENKETSILVNTFSGKLENKET